MNDGYDYANARLRAMKSRLLGRGEYAELAASAGVDDVIARLSRTAYRSAIEAALVRGSGWECLREALRRHFSQALANIARFFHGEALRLWRILAGRWEVFNVKTVLRGVAHHARTDEILGTLLPAGELRESDFARLVQQPSIRAVVDLLATWGHPYADPLLAAMPRYVEFGDLGDLELALDRARVTSARRQLAEMGDENAEIVRQALRAEIDAANIVVVLRLGAWEGGRGGLVARYGTSAPSTLLIEGGGTPTERLFAYRDVPTVERTVQDLDDTRFGATLRRGLAAYREERRLSAFEDEIDRQLAEESLAHFHRDPLTIGVAIAYVAALALEVRNLRVLGRGKDARWSREDIEAELRTWPS